MIVALCSGEGRTFDGVRRMLGHQVTHMITNVEKAPVLKKAQTLGVSSHCVPHSACASREQHEQLLLLQLKQCTPFKFILLLGYMRVLSAQFLQTVNSLWPECVMLNLHPAPLSLYKGAHGLRHAIRTRVPIWGISVHEVTSQLDNGPVIAYKPMPVYPTDTFEKIRERAHPIEVYAVLEAIDIISRRPQR